MVVLLLCGGSCHVTWIDLLLRATALMFTTAASVISMHHNIDINYTPQLYRDVRLVSKESYCRLLINQSIFTCIRQRP